MLGIATPRACPWRHGLCVASPWNAQTKKAAHGNLRPASDDRGVCDTMTK
ncbi:hypothetical protein JMJ77_0008012 [Colletotrichum scovillei]|uniref:Uncharacterized protein n=1 Tax=Colletotrichum scovillei TaxID=1209932 RepID=A0A9P7RFN5_9PEZI|nr:hypothetical protein JMJ77_0008012 [Colletotrichum scovillei]